MDVTRILYRPQGDVMHHTPARRFSPGYTAVELLVVVALIALLAAVSFPMFEGTFRVARLDGAARDLVGEIRHARSLAVSRGGYYGLHTSGNTYRVERVESSADLATWSSPTVVTQWQDLAQQFKGVTLAGIVNGDPIAGPIFNSLGASIDSTGSRSVTITLADASGATRVIQVSPTGNVRTP
jgi:prepilin-type N-terminal cleavage/methylation domain-containing protein